MAKGLRKKGKKIFDAKKLIMVSGNVHYIP